jgi:hypothetical protein
VVPAGLRERPSLAPELAFAWSAFWELCGDRPLGFGCVGPIPWAVIDRFAERHGIIDPDEHQRLVERLRVLDAVYREAVHRRDERPGPGA